MSYQLFSHQKFGSEFAQTKPYSANFSSPGTGKTLTYLDSLRHEPISRVLVLCTKSTMQCAWGNDIEKFTPELSYVCAYAHNRQRAFDSNAQCVIMNHDGINWLLKNPEYLKKFSHIVVDESRAFHNRNAQRSKALLALADTFDKRHIMTGTPTPNGICDIWNQIHFLDGGERLGKSFFQFRGDVCYPIMTNFGTEWVDKNGAEQAVYEKIKDIAFRFKLEDCIDMPQHIVTERFVSLPRTLMNQYNKLRSTLQLELENGAISVINQAALHHKLYQLASGAMYLKDGSYKIFDYERFDAVIEEALEVPQSIIVFNWRHQRDAIQGRLDVPFGLIDGSVNSHDRNKSIDAFQRGQLRTMLVHPRAAGHGITLTNGTRTVWCSPTYNAEEWEQTNHRIYRAGQKQRTETIVFCGLHTTETKALASFKVKDTRQNKFRELLSA